jgi:hypothetical protein
MNRYILIAWLTVLTLGFAYLAFRSAAGAPPASEPELALLMSRQQVWMDKLGASVRAENRELMDFYAHELEESTEGIIANVETYDGFKIADLTRSILIPDLQRLATAIDGAPISDVKLAYSRLIQSCNACHAATDHGFILITEARGESGWNQAF